jgi:hypothetical protein
MEKRTKDVLKNVACGAFWAMFWSSYCIYIHTNFAFGTFLVMPWGLYGIYVKKFACGSL